MFMASAAISERIKVYLSFYDANEYQSRFEQLRTGSVMSRICHFLAHKEIDGPLFVTGQMGS